MAYFRCSTGSASSGDGVALVVECDVNFAGSTITADNGEDIFTETCPSVSPYTVRFEGIPTGTYTISGVSQGQTFTTQFTVLDYETTLHTTPEGATVLPINDIQTWLHCANIWDKNYTTLDEVLADNTTLLALISSNNAADYMARSTSWTSSVTANSNAMTYIGANNYCANKLLANSTWLNAICNSSYFESVLNVKVPTMTGATTPSGEASASSVLSSYNTYYAWRAFNSSGSYGWVPTASANQWIQYKFNSKMVLHMVEVNTKAGSTTWTNPLTLQGSNDGNTFTKIADISPTNKGAYAQNVLPISNSNKYQYIRLAISGHDNANGLFLQFYGRA